MVDALFVDPKGIYPQLLGADHCWDVERDARTYAGDGPVVAHPPCQNWVNFAALNWKRYGKTLPAWYPGGTDEGCFESALLNVRRCGGVLEHPANSHAWNWNPHLMVRPNEQTDHIPVPGSGWLCVIRPSSLLHPSARAMGEYVCEVWQSAYGHAARKRTWLLYCGKRRPFELCWDRNPGTHQVGWFDRNKPTLGKREASATPVEFAKELIRLAEWSRP